MLAEVKHFVVNVDYQLIEGTFSAQIGVFDVIQGALGTMRAERAFEAILRAYIQKCDALLVLDATLFCQALAYFGRVKERW